MDLESIYGQLVHFATSYGIKIIGAILILIVGRFAAGFFRRIVRKVLTSRDVDAAVVSFAGSLCYALVLTMAVIASLAKFGVETTSFVAVIGAAGFAIGFALQGSLSNFAAGVLILVLRPYRVGDFIEAAGVSGSVKEIQLFTTVLATPDNIRILVPNGRVYGEVIKNITANPTRRVDMVVGIGYTSSIKKAYEILKELVNADSRVLSDPAPTIAVAELADSSVNFVVRPWVKKEDYWAVKFDLTEKIKHTFDEQGIEIPFPQRSIHMVTEDAA
ncbi:MAG: mechanosensitive ion channel [Candidatus Latescibacterota bacterium]|nr:MAG: mechanosensitive ion channel [Candidatus Latescibacterota bacterium]